jgi:hypothetical protein
MGDERDREKRPGKAGKADVHQARLEQALRANLLKRKAKDRAREPASAPPKEGGQS